MSSLNSLERLTILYIGDKIISIYKMIPFKGNIDLSTKFDLMPLFRCHFRLNPMIAIRFRPDSISIQGPADDVVTKSGVKGIATTKLQLSSLQKYNYECNREEVTVWLPYHIINFKGFKAFIMNMSPAPGDDSESDYSRVEISISELEGREPIVPILELFPIVENEKERIICNFEGTSTWASNCNYLMYTPESLISDTHIIRNMSWAYYNRRMNTMVIYDYDTSNSHVDGSEIVEICDGKLRIDSLETVLLTLELDESSGIIIGFHLNTKESLISFWGNEDPKLGLKLECHLDRIDP